MKQLKFMLAAATAIGIAAVAQAAADYGNSTDFEAPSVGSYPGSVEGWSVPSDGSNESEIIEDASMVKLAATKYTKKYGSEKANHTKALQVSTAGKPILRYIETNANKDGPNPITVSDTAKVYIDTMVQFTPTSVGEEPEPGADDKLMLYAQEVTNEVGDVKTVTTNLFVIASSINFEASECPRKYVDTGVVVAKDTWYRLTVEASGCVLEDWEEGNQQLNLFKIWLDGQPVMTGTQNDDPLVFFDNENVVFPSIQGVLPLGDDEQSTPVPATINSVGFAGEGKVDDLVLTTINPFGVDSVDFTFTIALGEGVSSVTYTIGGESVKITEETAVPDLDKDTEIVVTAEAKDWYKITAGTGTYTLTADETITVSAEKTANVVDGKVEVTENTKPADVYVEGGSFAAEGTKPEQLSKALNWALSKGGKTTAAAAGALVSGLDFADGEEETDAEKAYLLDCTEAELSGENGEIAKFKFAGFDLTDGFTVGAEKKVGNGAAYGNGYVEVRGSATVGGAYTDAADMTKHNFFKAFLVPFPPAAVDAE